MESDAQLSLEEYLRTSYRPDCEYVDGEVRERNVGGWEHGRMLAVLAGWFGGRERAWKVMGSAGQRVRISAKRVRVADLVLVRPGVQPDVLVEAPVLVVEVLSPEDSYSELEERCRDYHAMGVETVWLIDPRTRSGKVCRGMDWVGGERLTVAGTEIFVELSGLFSGLSSAGGQ